MQLKFVSTTILSFTTLIFLSEVSFQCTLEQLNNTYCEDAYSIGLLLPLCESEEAEGSCHFWSIRLAITLLAFQIFDEQKGSTGMNQTMTPNQFRIKPKVLNTGFDPATAIEAVVDSWETPAVALVGPSRSDVAVPVATLGKALHWPQVSYGATSTELSNSVLFPYFSRTTHTTSSSSLGMAGVIKYYGWTSAAVLYPSEEWGFNLLSKISASLAQLGHSVDLFPVSFVSGQKQELRDALDSIKSSGNRLILGLLLNDDIPTALDYAAEIGVIGEGYQWFGTDVAYDLGLDELKSGAASGDEQASQQLERRVQALRGALKVTVRSITGAWQQVDEVFRDVDADAFRLVAAEAGAPQYTVSLFKPGFFSNGFLGNFTSSTPAYAYDAVWAVALALASLHDQLQPRDGAANATLVGAEERAKAIFAAVVAQDFEGVTGRVRFNATTGDRLDSTFKLELNFFDAEEAGFVPAGLYDPANDTLVLIGPPIVWPDGTTSPPSLAPGSRREILQTALVGTVAVLVFLLLLAGIGMVYYRRTLGERLTRLAEMRQKRRGPPVQGGHVALAITDIQGSTTLWDRLPEAMARDIKVHHRILRHLLQKVSGYEVATEGDSFKCAFHTAEDAVAWAVLVQINLHLAPWSPELEDGGHAILRSQPDWANPDVPTMSEVHMHAIDALGAYGPTMRHMQQIAGKSKETIPPLFSPPRPPWAKRSSIRGAIPLIPVSGDRPQEMPVFRGLRVRIGIHAGTATDVSANESTKRAVYGGAVAVMAEAVSKAPVGGQIIMSGETLAAIPSMDGLAARVAAHCRWAKRNSGGVSVMHLGQHAILNEEVVATGSNLRSIASQSQLAEDGPGAVDGPMSAEAELIEVVPWLLKDRSKYFPPPQTIMQISAAFSQAPTAEGVTIVFAWFEKYKSCLMFSPSGMPEIMAIYNRILRNHIQMHDGYEVENDNGVFVVAFSSAVSAMSWALDVQLGLLHAEWPASIRVFQDMPELSDPVTGAVLFRGPRCGIGMCTGKAEIMQPCPRTGRAEYFGSLMNHAARVAFSGVGGQVLLHDRTWSAVHKEARHGAKIPEHHHLTLGAHSLKGIKDAVVIHQVSPPSLVARQFPMIKTVTAIGSEGFDEVARYLSQEAPILRQHLNMRQSSSAVSSRTTTNSSNTVENAQLPGTVPDGNAIGDAEISVPALSRQPSRESIETIVVA
uniref:Adenylate cyclase n=2 Tax=Tetraselmis sp. GSL018 TaxID=582737 RepID=A0A061RGM2_9CHLO